MGFARQMSVSFADSVVSVQLRLIYCEDLQLREPSQIPCGSEWIWSATFVPLYARVENSEERVHSIKNSLLFELKERKIDRILNIEIERSAAGKTKKVKKYWKVQVQKGPDPGDSIWTLNPLDSSAQLSYVKDYSEKIDWLYVISMMIVLKRWGWVLGSAYKNSSDSNMNNSSSSRSSRVCWIFVMLVLQFVVSI